MRIAITGHRPQKLNNEYDGVGPISDLIRYNFKDTLTELFNVTHLNVGMALGVDMIAAEVGLELGIPVIAYVPFLGQEKKWPKASQGKYHTILNKATEVIIVSDGGYTPHKMQLRNQRMVDDADWVFAVWDGTPSGTANCVKYAESKKKTTYVLNPHTGTVYFNYENTNIYK